MASKHAKRTGAIYKARDRAYKRRLQQLEWLYPELKRQPNQPAPANTSSETVVLDWEDDTDRLDDNKPTFHIEVLQQTADQQQSSDAPSAPSTEAGQWAVVLQHLTNLGQQISQINQRLDGIDKRLTILQKTAGITERVVCKIRDTKGEERQDIAKPVFEEFILSTICTEEELKEFERQLDRDETYRMLVLTALQKELLDWDPTKRLRYTIRRLFSPEFLVMLRWSARFGKVALSNCYNTVELLARAACTKDTNVTPEFVEIFCTKNLKTYGYVRTKAE